jgi:PAS domain S-box-containing protein
LPRGERIGTHLMNGPALLADHIDGRTDALIGVWRDAVERQGDVPEAERLSYREFVDHIPALLERLTDRLRGIHADPGVEGRQHGRVRWRQGYDIAELVREMSHLRTTLLRATVSYANAHGFDLATVDSMMSAIHDVLDEAIAESVQQFQEDSLATTRSAREDAEERRRAVERARSESEAEKLTLRTILDSLPVGVWVLDGNGIVRQINGEAERLQGFPASRVVGRLNINDHQGEPSFRVNRPDGTEYGPGEIPPSRALRGEHTGPEEMVWHLPSGTLYATVNAVPLADSDGVIVGATVVVADITESKRLEAKLAASEARFRTMVEQSPVMIRRSNSEGQFEYFNRRWLDFRGRAEVSETGQGWVEGVDAGDRPRVLDTYWAAFHARSPFSMEYRLLRRDGEFRWVADHGIPLYDGDGDFRGYLASSIDITDRRELEDALKNQSVHAEEASLHKTRLLAALSHDARTPLNSVVLSAQLLEMHIADRATDPEVEECLRTIRNSVKNVLDLLEDLLDLSKIDAGATPVEVSRFEIAPMLDECVSSIEAQARAKGLGCRVEAGGLVGAVVETDRAKLKQILGNFLTNALRYTERGHIRVFGSLTADQVRISVEDSGMGIALEDQAIIFDEFATLTKPHRRPTGGTGLGLAICKRLAGLLKGHIELRSAPNAGSTFTLVLPGSVLTSATLVEPDTTHHASPAEVARSGLIVVAEDDPSNRLVLGRVLRRLGYRVLEAVNGREAIELVRANMPTALLVDVNMPEMDGIEATIALRADPEFRNLPIFALTGDVSAVNRRRIGDAGVDGYLEKPITLEVLKRTLGSLDVPRHIAS